MNFTTSEYIKLLQLIKYINKDLLSAVNRIIELENKVKDLENKL